MNGFIKMPRDFLEWEWWGRVPHHFLFEWLLINARVDDRRVKGIVVRRGSLLTTWNEMQQAVGCSRGTLSRALSDLSDSGEILIRTDCKKTLITICHYEHYNGNGVSLWTENGLKTDCERTAPPIINREKENEENNIYSAHGDYADDDGFVTEADCRLWMRRYSEIAVRYGVGEGDLPRQLNAARSQKIRILVRERGRGSVDAMFARLAESPYYFLQGSGSFRGDFTKLWSPSVFDMVLEGSFVPRKAKEAKEEPRQGALVESHELTVPERQSRKEQLEGLVEYDRDNPAAKGSFRYGVLLQAYESGELEKLGIDWKPNKQ